MSSSDSTLPPFPDEDAGSKATSRSSSPIPEKSSKKRGLRRAEKLEKSTKPKSMKEQLLEIKECVDLGVLTEEEAKMARAAVLDSIKIAVSEPKTTTPDPDSLATYLKASERRAQQPWRKDYEQYQAIAHDWEEMSMETLQELFVDDAKNGQLQASEAMLGIYLLFGGEKELQFLRRLLVNAKGSLRLLMHNFYVADHRGEAFLNLFGNKLTELTDPLFPHTKDFTALNAMMLNQVDSTSGGGEGKRFFRKEDEPDPLGGGSQFAVLTSAEGTQYVDLACVEQVCDNLQSQINSLKAFKAKGGVKGNGYWKNKKNYYNNNNNYQQNYNQQNNHPPHYNNQQTYQGKGNPMGGGDPLPTIPTPGQSTTKK